MVVKLFGAKSFSTHEISCEYELEIENSIMKNGSLLVICNL